jgi:hypothetical protein
VAWALSLISVFTRSEFFNGKPKLNTIALSREQVKVDNLALGISIKGLKIEKYQEVS